MLETEFVDRSIALAGKAFISFFPLLIVVAAFMPAHLRTSIFTTVSHRLGITGASLGTVRQAFASRSGHPPGHRPARPGPSGLLRQLVHDRAAARLPPRLSTAPREGGRQLRPGGRLGGGGPRRPGAAGWRAQPPGGRRGDSRIRRRGAGPVHCPVVVLTAWLMLKGQVRLRVLFPSGLITAIALSAYALSATLWMPNNVTSNNHQYGIFGVALALVAWFSGAAICIVVGACAGPVLAEDPGPIGRLVRGGAGDLPSSRVPCPRCLPGAIARSRRCVLPQR